MADDNGENWQPPGFDKMLSSKPFRFLVGPEKKEYFVNEEAVRNLSDVFHPMLDGPCEEAKTRTAELDDVTIPSFVRLCEFAYNGNYTNPRPEKWGSRKRSPSRPADSSSAKRVRRAVAAASASPENPSPPASNSGESSSTELGTAPEGSSKPSGWAPHSTFSGPFSLYSACRNYENCESKKKKQPAKEHLPNPQITKDRYMIFMEFISMRMHWEEPSLPRDQRLEHVGPNHYWAPVFLAHAEMYRLGDKYDIQKLRDASRAKLHQALKFWLVCPERIGDLVELVHYLYDNTVPRDKMREMVYLYWSAVAEDIYTCPEVKAFMPCAQEFSSRLVEIFAAQMHKARTAS
ncbi:hypothetical protein MKZ38_002054 [Zalerion maritima]|uniref:BTB domain-containing protein n=1 Tax=Zalerion maritima TaxID=339359 RepID=A0AAD5RYV1_9PEZI|nr:hypothetical protein MKZ38_002054 [Zalerion maritima]